MYRKRLDAPWHCSWCNYTHVDPAKVIDHENKEHGGGQHELKAVDRTRTYDRWRYHPKLPFFYEELYGDVHCTPS